MKNREMMFSTQRLILRWYCIHNEELTNDIEYTMKKWEIILNTQWKLRNDIVYRMNNWEMILNTQRRTEKWYWIHNEEMRNDIEDTM